MFWLKRKEPKLEKDVKITIDFGYGTKREYVLADLVKSALKFDEIIIVEFKHPHFGDHFMASIKNYDNE